MINATLVLPIRKRTMASKLKIKDDSVMKGNSSGFTFIELMIVVTIIGILASISIPKYNIYRSQSHIVEGMVLAAPFTAAISDYYSYHGTFPVSNQSLALPTADAFAGEYVKGIEVVDGAIQITFRSDYEGGSMLSLRPAVVMSYPPADSLSWLCGYVTPIDGMRAYGENKTDIPRYYLPPNCHQ